jgi:hypothetical protein
MAHKGRFRRLDVVPRTAGTGASRPLPTSPVMGQAKARILAALAVRIIVGASSGVRALSGKGGSVL